MAPSSTRSSCSSNQCTTPSPSAPELRPTIAEWVAGIGTPLAAQFRPYAATEADLEHLIHRYRSYQVAHHDQMTRSYDGVLDVVRGLSERGYPLGVVTSKGNELANLSIAHVGLAPYFRTVVGIECTTRHKPNPEPVWFALAQIGRAPTARSSWETRPTTSPPVTPPGYRALRRCGERFPATRSSAPSRAMFWIGSKG